MMIEKTLDELLSDYLAIDTQEDSIDTFENISKQINLLEPKDEIFINKILDTLENDDLTPVWKIVLSCNLQALHLCDIQIQRALHIIYDQKNTCCKEYLIEILRVSVQEGNPLVINSFYQEYLKEISIEQKLPFAKILLESDEFNSEITLWLFDIANDESLPEVIDDTDTMALKLICLKLLATKESNIKKVKQIFFHYLIKCDFLKDWHDIHWKKIEKAFIELPFNDDDIMYILKLSKDKQLISYHRIHFLKMLTMIKTNFDITTPLISFLTLNDEAFDDFNNNITTILNEHNINYESIVRQRNG